MRREEKPLVEKYWLVRTPKGDLDADTAEAAAYRARGYEIDGPYFHMNLIEVKESPSRVEASEWPGALDAAVSHDGPDRARQIPTRVMARA